ncbi:MAG: tetratricopeptide repeat protein [Deltaproteobacteria bacterium]|nr:tetratricopeptide repeat protein [Deltaproteobacteria bacterium]
MSQPSGVLVIIDPGPQDDTGLAELARLVQAGSHKPTVLVVSRTYNAFQYMGLFPGLAVAQIKSKGRKFILDLPAVEAADLPEIPQAPQGTKAASAASAAKGGGEIPAPRFQFAGREEELPALVEMLQGAGPVVVSGPRGVGRTWLVEHAIESAGLKRLPEVMLGQGVGYDALMGRLITLTQGAGVSSLTKAVQDRLPPLAQIEAAVTALREAEGLRGQVMVIHNLHLVTGRAGDFFRKSKLELLVRTLLTQDLPLKLVFISRVQPRFFRHDHNTTLQRMELKGLKGRFLHEIFDAYKAPEFPRDRFGPIAENIHGHPFAARAFAIEVRERENGLGLTEDPKFLKAQDLEDARPLLRVLEKRIAKLAPEARATLARLAHLRMPSTGQTLADMGLGRRDRLQLLAMGVLDMVGTETDRRYRVHPLVRAQLPMRETSDFDIMNEVGELYARMGRDADENQRIAWVQEANRNLIGSRRFNNLIALRFPDGDALIESCYGLIRAKEPRFDLADRRLRDVLKVDPTNSDAYLLKAEMFRRAERSDDEIQAIFDQALEHAAVPEVYHELVNWHLSRRSAGMGIVVLEKAIEAMPDESRLRTRLAAMLFKADRAEDAIAHLRVAMDLDPMLPDAYGLLGQARRMEGADGLVEAEELLREAVRLAPGDPVQTSRLVALLLDKARLYPDQREGARTEARELLDLVIQGDQSSADSFVLLAQLLREDGVDVERRGWLLDKAHKLRPKGMDRFFRYNLERAYLAMARGELDRAEKGMRQLVKREGSHYLVRIGLAEVLEAQGFLIPAFAELKAAYEQLPEASLERPAIQGSLDRLSAAIQVQASLPPAAPVAEEAEVAPVALAEEAEDALPAPAEALAPPAPSDGPAAEEGDEVAVEPPLVEPALSPEA